MRVAITARMRNGALWEAAQKMGSIKLLAEHLGLPYSEMVALINLRTYPAYRNPKSTRNWGAIEKKLVDLVGLLLEDIFPPELATSEFMDSPRVRTIIREIPVLQLTAVKETELLLPPPQEELESEMDNEVLAQNISNVMDTLTDQERKVLTLRFGLDRQGERTQEECGHAIGASKARAAQIEAKALRKLRHPSRSRHIRAFWGCNHDVPEGSTRCVKCMMVVKPLVVTEDDDTDTLEAAIKARKAREGSTS